MKKKSTCNDVMIFLHIYINRGQSLKNLLGFSRRHCLQLFPVFLDKNFLAFQSSKASYLKLRLTSNVPSI